MANNYILPCSSETGLDGEIIISNGKRVLCTEAGFKQPGELVVQIAGSFPASLAILGGHAHEQFAVLRFRHTSHNPSIACSPCAGTGT